MKNTGEQLCHHQDRVITRASDVPKWPLSQSFFLETEVRLQVVADESLMSSSPEAIYLLSTLPNSLLRREYRITGTKREQSGTGLQFELLLLSYK